MAAIATPLFLLPSLQGGAGGRLQGAGQGAGFFSSLEFGFAPGAVFVLENQFVGLVAQKVAALGIGAHVVAHKAVVGFFLFLYTIVVEALEKTVRHQAQTHDGEHNGHLENGTTPLHRFCQTGNGAAANGEHGRGTAQQIDVALADLDIEQGVVVSVPHHLQVADIIRFVIRFWRIGLLGWLFGQREQISHTHRGGVAKGDEGVGVDLCFQHLFSFHNRTLLTDIQQGKSSVAIVDEVAMLTAHRRVGDFDTLRGF